MNWLSPLFSSFSINLQAWKIPFNELENREQLNLWQWLCANTQQPPLLDKILNRSSTLKNVSLLKLSHKGQHYTIGACLKLIFFPQTVRRKALESIWQKGNDTFRRHSPPQIERWRVWQAFETEGKGSFWRERNPRGACPSLLSRAQKPIFLPFQTPARQANKRAENLKATSSPGVFSFSNMTAVVLIWLGMIFCGL